MKKEKESKREMNSVLSEVDRSAISHRRINNHYLPVSSAICLLSDRDKNRGGRRGWCVNI